MKNKYVFLGDSLIFGYGVKPKENWVNLLKNKYNLDIHNRGVNGSTTVDMLVRFQKDVINLNPTNLFLMGGTNDFLSNRSVQSTVDNLEIMIKDSLSNNINVILGIPPTIIPNMAKKLFIPCDTYDYCKKSLSELRSLILDLCNKYNLQHIDFYTITNSIKNNDYLFIDGIHFSPVGHELLLLEAEKTIN